MFTADDAAQADRFFHDILGGFFGSFHHRAVVGEDRNVDMDIAIASVHMGGDDNPFGTDFHVYAFNRGADLAVTAEQLQEVG